MALKTYVKTFKEIEDAVRNKHGRVVVPMANNYEAQMAVKGALEEGLISTGILIGDKKLVEEVAKETGLDLSKFELVDIGDQKEAAREAVKLMAEGKGDFLLKGIIDTKYYLKAVLDKEFNMVEEGRLLSHVALMEVPNYHKFIGITDVAVNISPGVEEKIKMVNNIVEVFHKLGVEKPKVAMICPVEKVNPKIESTMHAQAVVEHFKGSEECIVEGPYDTYIALSKHAAEEKGVTGEVCGDADILVFPDLNSANPVYKIMNQFIPNIKSAAIVAGAKVPVMLPSRADSAETKRLSIALSAYLSQSQI